MSIDPVPGYRSGGEFASGDAQTGLRQQQSIPSLGSAVEKTVQPGAGTALQSVKVNTPSSEFPPDEVHLQLDTQIRDQVIIKYTDKVTGEVVLQVPSAQALGVARGIYQDFQRETKLRSTEHASQTEAGGEKPHGH